MSTALQNLLPLAELLAAALLVVGALFVFIGSLGLFRLGDFYSRLHGPSKSTTLGIGAILAGSALVFSIRGTISLHEALITFFLFITAPVSAHLLAKAALHLGIRGTPPARLREPDGR